MTAVTAKSPVAPIKKFWADHKVKIMTASTVVSTTAAVVFHAGLRQHDAFLKENGLYDQFYAINEEE